MFVKKSYKSLKINKLTFLMGGVFLSPLIQAQTWQDTIGYTKLKAEMGANLPKGAGISVTQVEANEVSGSTSYQPTLQTNPTSGNYSGKNFQFSPGGSSSVVSGHAVRVADFFYGVNTSPESGDASVAPLVGQGTGELCRVRDTSSLLGTLQTSPKRPELEVSEVANHSWIGQTGSNEVLQRLDYHVEDNDYVCVVGLNNGSSTTIPAYMASAYNVIAVGRSDGEHSTGTTPTGYDGAGRSKPDLVTPLDRTSWGTAVVSSCAALLASHAASQTAWANATKNETLRAILLASASKKFFPSWANTDTRPLDSRYGAGMINIYHAVKMLESGEAAPSSTTVAKPRGWDYIDTLAGNGQSNYRVKVPAGSRGQLSATLVWNRRFTFSSSTQWQNASPQVANLNLQLLQTTAGNAAVDSSLSGSNGSVSTTTEHVYVPDLAPGEYLLRVTNGSGGPTVDCAVAWQVFFTPTTLPDLTRGSGSALQGRGLLVGETYRVQASNDLLNWSVVETLTPTTATASLTTALSLGGNARRFYRLEWPAP
jgi:hypothetical protein